MEHVERVVTGAATGRSPATTFHISQAIVLGGILAVAAALRFAFLGHNSVWFDEAYVVRISLFPPQAIPALLRTAEFHPPLFYFLMKAWIGVAGFREVAIRIPSACCGVLAVGLTYAVARRVASEPVGLLSALLVGLAPFAVMAGQDAKMYALLGALTLASMLALFESIEHDETGRWGAYVLATTLMVYTHYLGFLVVLAQGVWVAWFERAHLRRWLIAALVIAIFFAPWGPSFWSQITRTPPAGWGEHVSLLDLSQLLGLYAFGGSLLGMPSFFFKNTSLGPFEQLLLLLPFVAVAWRGSRAFIPEGRRQLAFLGLPLIVPIGVTFAVSLSKPLFEARWFSFLLPFYAMLLARGIIDVAEHFRDHHREVAAGLAAGLLLYSVPVFHRYYFDPHFRPYQWREAATLVRSRASAGDFFVYGDYQNELAFTYYFGATPAEMLLLPKQDISAIRRLAARYPRLWLIVAPPMSEATLDHTLEGLRGAYTSIGRSGFNGRGVFPVIYLLAAAQAAR
jgi:mannosyltransferase